MATGLSMTTNSTLNSSPSGVFQTFPGLMPLLARMIGAQPAQMFKAKRTVLSFSAVVRGLLDFRQALGWLEAVLLDRGYRRGAVGRFGVLAQVLQGDLAPAIGAWPWGQ